MCRIISEFHDYYDCMMRHAQDRTLLYMRKTEEINNPPKFEHIHYYNYRSLSSLSHVSKFIIGFCGKLHYAIKVESRKLSPEPDVTAICYNLADVDEFMEKHLKKRELEQYYEKSKRGRWGRYISAESHEGIENFFKETATELETKEKQFESLFVQYKTPIFVVLPENPWSLYQTRKLYVNPCLNEYDFVRVKDPATAFQEITMWLTNFGQPNPTIPHVSDEDMIVAKGFNEWSFRKPPKGK